MNRKRLNISVMLLAAFALWTVAVYFVDVKAIGPQNSSVGFAEVNQRIHDLTGVHFQLYSVTDWLGLVPISICIGFAAFGLAQWVGRKDIRKVDFDILVLGGFYIVTALLYVLFEYVVINYRPVLIHGVLEASYPSSTTVLVLCVMPTAIMQLRTRIRNTIIRKLTTCMTVVYIAFMVLGRLVSGVHWFTDIVGGGLLSAGLVMMYRFLCGLEKEENRR